MISDEIDYRLLSEKILTAHKPHVCSACKKEIAKGSRYIRIVAMAEGKMEIAKYHHTCPGEER